MSRYRDTFDRTPLSSLTAREVEAMNAEWFERDFARSRHNFSEDDFGCSECRGRGCDYCLPAVALQSDALAHQGETDDA